MVAAWRCSASRPARMSVAISGWSVTVLRRVSFSSAVCAVRAAVRRTSVRSGHGRWTRPRGW
ncbi:hypothetical protein ACFFX0_07485 [Citricoccus parietis]|uniref:Uncharacterized protein n=1 Tax=Citricoccus parietis TaxID=592307 RepID=A0ABV5FWJ2_9MICC